MSVADIPREFRTVALADIDEPALPSRSSMDETELDNLTESIRTIGLQQPMVLARVGDRLEVIAGHRRWHACRRAGLTEAPCIVYAEKRPDLVIVQAHENARREKLNAADEAIWFMELLENQCGGDIEKLCGMVGEKLSYVDNRLSLFRGDPEVFKALQEGKVKIGVAHVINRCPDAHYRKAFLVWAMTGGANATTVEGWLLDWRRNVADMPAPAQPVPAEEPGMAGEPHNPFTCICCNKADLIHTIRQLSIHQHCWLAILQPLLANARGES